MIVLRTTAMMAALLAAFNALAQAPTAPTTSAGTTPATNGPPLPTVPSLGGTLSANPKPLSLDGGPFGKIFVTGVLSGLGFYQDSPSPGDHGAVYDISNGQIFIQNTTGLVQFYVEAGAYSLPALGVPYLRSDVISNGSFGPLPEAYVKLAPNATWSIEAGKLPTLIGAESTFTVQNLNIFRGLLWGQEPAISRGVQVNYSKGSFSAAASWNDGFYSNLMDWGTLSLTDAVTAKDSVTLVGGANFGRSGVASTATPYFQNNEQIYNLIYTRTQGPWTIEPYVQYTSVPQWLAGGITQSASTFGAALLLSYALDAKSHLAGVSLPFRVEYINSQGTSGDGAPNLLYGSDSNAYSFTLTPTYQRGSYFLRAEASYVTVGSPAANSAFGPYGTTDHQTRLALETGIIF